MDEATTQDGALEKPVRDQFRSTYEYHEACRRQGDRVRVADEKAGKFPDPRGNSAELQDRQTVRDGVVESGADVPNDDVPEWLRAALLPLIGEGRLPELAKVEHDFIVRRARKSKSIVDLEVKINEGSQQALAAGAENGGMEAEKRQQESEKTDYRVLGRLIESADHNLIEDGARPVIDSKIAAGSELSNEAAAIMNAAREKVLGALLATVAPLAVLGLPIIEEELVRGLPEYFRRIAVHLAVAARGAECSADLIRTERIRGQDQLKQIEELNARANAISGPLSHPRAVTLLAELALKNVK